MTIRPLSPRRLQTFYFLDEIRGFAPVFLDTEVDMTQVEKHRAASRAAGTRYSVVSYVVHCAARVLADHPQANAALRGRHRPYVAVSPDVNVKIALDKRMAGERVTLSAVLPRAQLADLAEIQGQVEHFRDGDADQMPEFEHVRRLQRLPAVVGRLAYRFFVRSLSRRPSALGTVAVTSLGHRAVDGFHSVGGTTVTLGIGRIVARPVVRGGAIVVAPTVRLNLAFDHRVIDGAEAADVLTEIRDSLERFDPGAGTSSEVLGAGRLGLLAAGDGALAGSEAGDGARS
ncbi:2-oxo acid dehydrogenase subunit E2 [Frankia sp. AgB1.9]|uniref:2-oxo acid dehydrogenase subunit E2 n=1 Tax=unclassified Frankia TaxID=2632575 RepID=UPI0027DB2FB6|nr:MULTISPECIES: 2-oxo acid dehydrogenase subunit E2 [unclassified Frankia]MBL7491582.1 2-oxo acid dehydrogenase subunit E2 [Frankia sp. AgW1.1]MBL7553172.1 2-oxo acid dehydrogenase subunit E2 [Frankia sp. AgB1.9]